MNTRSGQKLTKSGKPIVNKLGLPVYNSSVDKRINIIKDMLYIGCNKNDRKWSEISNSLRTI